MAKQVIKVGDLVRVPRRSVDLRHHLAFGTVSEVLEVDTRDGTYWVRGWTHAGKFVAPQWVSTYGVRLAKQAMKQRDAYRERR